MKTITDELVADMVRAIVREVDPESVYLFGSRAKGEDKPGSDIDLLVVESEPFGPERSRWHESSRLWDLVAQFRVPVDILLYSRDEVNRWRDAANHVVGRATREGKLLYARR